MDGHISGIKTTALNQSLRLLKTQTPSTTLLTLMRASTGVRGRGETDPQHHNLVKKFTFTLRVRKLIIKDSNIMLSAIFMIS